MAGRTPNRSSGGPSSDLGHRCNLPLGLHARLPSRNFARCDSAAFESTTSSFCRIRACLLAPFFVQPDLTATATRLVRSSARLFCIGTQRSDVHVDLVCISNDAHAAGLRCSFRSCPAHRASACMPPNNPSLARPSPAMNAAYPWRLARRLSECTPHTVKLRTTRGLGGNDGAALHRPLCTAGGGGGTLLALDRPCRHFLPPRVQVSSQWSSAWRCTQRRARPARRCPSM